MNRVLFAVVIFSVMTLSAPSSSAGEPVQIFGLPLGGALVPAIKTCTRQQSDSGDVLCWKSKPFQPASGGKLGRLQIPDESLPSWAAYASHRAITDANGLLVSITTRTSTPGQLRSISESISSRFGEPTEVKGTNLKEMVWELPDIYIHLIQYGNDCCEIRFKTPDEIARNRAEQESRAKREAARPRSP